MKMTADYGAHIRLPQAAVDMEQVKRDLLITNKGFQINQAMGFAARSGLEETVKLWALDGDHVVLPRGYQPPLHSHVDLEVRDIRRTWPQVPWPKFKKELWADQLAPYKAMTDTLGKDKLLQLICGGGKTEMALCYAGDRRVSTLIVVDQESIATQWLERITGNPAEGLANRCYDLKPEDVGWIQGAKYKIGKQFTIAFVDTLYRRLGTFDLSFWDHFGLVILDEAHIGGSPTRSQVVSMFSGERLALTATPKRKDGMEAAFLYHVGGLTPVYTGTEIKRSAHWYFKNIGEIVPEEIEARCYKRGRDNERGDSEYAGIRLFQRPLYINQAVKSGNFFDRILIDVSEAVKAGRRCLVLGDRVEHMQALAESLRDAYGINAACVHAMTKKKEKQRAFNECQVILGTGGTSGIAGKALDLKNASALFILTPYKGLDRMRQESGRIGRQKGAPDPVVVVYCHDKVLNLRNAAEQMRQDVAKLDPKAVVTKIDSNGEDDDEEN